MSDHSSQIDEKNPVYLDFGDVEDTSSSKSAAPEKEGWFARLKQGLKRSSSSLTESISALVIKRRLDEEVLQDLEDILIQADLGVETATQIVHRLRKERFGKEASEEDVRGVLADEIVNVIASAEQPLALYPQRSPHIILMIGVNGTGKTTTIGKLASKMKAQGLSVMIGAGDTFRAAAIEQLEQWGKRADVPVVSAKQGSDPSGLVYDALSQAKAAGSDVLLIDTAGRLQNKTELMDELSKIIRVIKKQDLDAPHDVLLTLDATTGQNALSQMRIFQKEAGVTGLIVTKLDGTAKGGIAVPLVQDFDVPIHFIGVGEGIDDLQPFKAQAYARIIAGQEDLS